MIHKSKKQTFTASYTINYGVAKKQVQAISVIDAINQLPNKVLKNLYSITDSQGHDYINNLFI